MYLDSRFFSLFYLYKLGDSGGLLRGRGGDAKSVMNITLISFAVVGAPASYILGIWFDWGAYRCLCRNITGRGI